MAKRTYAKEDRNDTSERAVAAERAWRKANPDAAASVPSAEVRDTRDTRRAKVEYQRTHGDETTKRHADEVRRREREDDAERERLRARRHRPHKHLPGGLVELPFVQTERHTAEGTIVMVEAAEKSAPGVKIALGIRSGARVRTNEAGELVFVPAPDDELGVEYVTPELAAMARKLRSAMRVRPYDRERFGHRTAATMLVKKELAQAIREAHRILSKAWISSAIERVTDALQEIHRVAHGMVHMVPGVPAHATDPATIHRSLAREVGRLGVSLPPYATVEVIAWMLGALAVGVARGGGRKARVSAGTMREVLGDEKELRRRMAQTRP